MKPVFTIVGAAAGAALAGWIFFTGFTEKSNWHRSPDGTAFISAYDSAFHAGAGALGGGLLGTAIDFAIGRRLLKRQTRLTRKQLLALRESPQLGEEEKYAIDLTLAHISENPVTTESVTKV